jgi:hypothetical protein
MIVTLREERCAIDGLLLEGKKKKPSNLLQRLGFDRFFKTITFYQLLQLFLFQDHFFGL